MKVITKNWIIAACLLLPHFTYAAWDIIDKSMAAWNVNEGTDQNKAWSLSKTYLTATQQDGYVNLEKLSGADGYMVPVTFTTTNTNSHTVDIKARINPINKVTYPDTDADFEANQISVRVGNRRIRLYLVSGDATNGYISNTATTTEPGAVTYTMNTADWHIYRFVIHPASSTYDVYVDNGDEPVLRGLKPIYETNSNSIFIGGASRQRCDMDIEYVKAGTGNLSLKTQIREVNVNSDSHIAGNARSINVTVNTDLVADGQQIFLALYNENNVEQTTPLTLTVNNNTVATAFSIPAGLAKGKYFIKAYAQDNVIGSVNVKPVAREYYIVDSSPITTQILPQVTPVGFIIDMDDYVYQPPTKELIFPTVIDTKEHLVDGKFLNNADTLHRYYWFHSPHDDPGGLYLNTGPTLDGPWTEQGLILPNSWAQSHGISTSHISSFHIIWNNVYDKYFMYFHGNNDRTHYCTSDDLLNWTYGAQVVTYEDFSFSSREASYARVFEHEVPGYNNKYVMLLMINENAYRTIYWGHSNDGITWTGVREPLISSRLSYKTIPGTTTKPQYSNNVSGPYFMRVDDRNFVFFHSSAGNISVAEIGEKFDREIHWGTYINKADVVISEDANGNPAAVSRVASPFFIQDDSGTWYLFVEAGHRLGANTAYAKGTSVPTSIHQEKVKNSPFLIYNTANKLVLKNESTKNGTYKLYNTLGSLIADGIAHTGENSIQLIKGMYIIVLSYENENHIIKTIKN